MRILIISILLSIALLGCSHRSDPRLVRLEQMASSGDDSARVALDSLLSLAPAQLTDADRHFYDFLSVKIADKAYVNHTSDSLILSVISHEEAHQGNGRYPEALYYGGRVYSDLGDYPTALQYFQQALDELPEDADLILRATVLNQTARLFNSLRLYDQAILHLEEAIAIDKLNNDSISLMYDTNLLGVIYLHQDRCDEAESCFYRARNLAERVSKIDIYQPELYLADIKLQNGELDSALCLIRPVMDGIHTLDRHAALAIASNIYLKNGILDTAWMYSQELIHYNNTYNRITGYKIALSDELRNYLHEDSISSYISAYRTLVNKDLKRNDSREALMQNSLYNYRLHERERAKAERDRANLLIMIALILVVVVCLIAFVYYQRYKNKSNMLQLHQALDNLKTLRESMASDKSVPQASDNTSAQDNTQRLKDRLKDELLQLLKANGNSLFVSPDILRSEAYAMLQSFIEKNKAVPESSPLWKNLDKVVTESSKDFKYRLQLLLGGKPTEGDYNMALLIKCGTTPTQMSILLGRTKSTIAYRREKFSIRIFGQKMELSLIDKLICLL